jgi:hypothetical protein
MRKRAALAAFAIFTFAMIVCAQEQVPALKPTPPASGNKGAPPLALEIYYDATLPPAYLKVEGPEVKPHWIWMARFPTIPGWQLPQGAERINAVRVSAQWNGETAEVKVALLRGANFYDVEEIVSSYQTGLDEPTVITRLESYGIQPFKITLISPREVVPPPPTLENRTMSVEVLDIKSEGLPLAAYRATFRNLSAKNLAALHVEIYRGGRGPTIVTFQGEDGRPLIVSNGSVSKYIPASVAEKSGESSTPSAATANSVIISSAIFTDGTFEGAVEPACRYEKYLFGRKAWLKRALKIIDEQRSQTDDTESAQQLREKIGALRYARTGRENAFRSVVSPQCPNPASFAEGAFSAENLRFIQDLDVVAKTHPKPFVTFKVWLESTREKYQQWLSNLKEFPSPRVAPDQ